MSDSTSQMVTLWDYFLHWLTVFVIGIGLWKGAVIEGNKARYDHYRIRRDLRRMFKKMKIQDLEKEKKWILK